MGDEMINQPETSVQGTGDVMQKNTTHLPETAPPSSTLTDMYDKQDVHLKKKDSTPEIHPSRMGMLFFVVGLVSFSIFLFFYSIGPEKHFLDYFFISASICVMLFGVVILRNTLYVLKPLVGGSLLATITFIGCGIGCIFIIVAHDVFILIIGLVYISIAVPTFIAFLCAIFRRKHRWAILGGMSGFVLGIITLVPMLIIMALASLALLIISEEDFKD